MVWDWLAAAPDAEGIDDRMSNLSTGVRLSDDDAPVPNDEGFKEAALHVVRATLAKRVPDRFPVVVFDVRENPWSGWLRIIPTCRCTSCSAT
jgi:hypothetical protein